MRATDTTRPAEPIPEVELDGPAERPGRRRRIWLWVPAGLAVLAAAGAGYGFFLGSEAADPVAVQTGPASTAEVARTTLTATETLPGTLGYAAPVTVTSANAGTITRLVDQGTTVERGSTLYWVDERPVSLLYGTIPMYRDLSPGDTGLDVEQLEANLVALGYDGFTADDEYTWYTEAAVREWQADIGADRTGSVARSDVVFLAAGTRVGNLHTDVGDPVSPGAAILDITGTDQVVSLEADVDDRDLVAVDTELTVVLPGGTEVAGTVTSAAVVEAASETNTSNAGLVGGSETETETIIEAEITLAEAAPQEFIGAPVEVLVRVDERADVLAVPVNALLALAEGGYGLEVVGLDGSTSIVAVDTGLFAEGRVEVTGEGITEGAVVGVASR